MLYDILVRSHSGMRWIVLLLLIAVVISSLPAAGRSAPGPLAKRLSLYTLIFVHLNAVVGIVLYMMSPKVRFAGNTMSDSLLRFFTVEHIFGMLVAIILVTMAHRKSKTDNLRGMFWYYTIALLIMLISIPWPFRGLGTGWF